VRLSYCIFSVFKRQPSAVVDFHISQFLWKIQICAYIFVIVQNLEKIGLSAADLLRIFDFQNGGHLPPWISYFHNFCEKFKFAPSSTLSCKIWWKSDDARRSYYIFSIFKMVAVDYLGFHISAILWKKNQICAYIFLAVRNLVKIRLSTAELLCIFDFQNGGRPPSWIWYDVIAHHPWLVFDGLNILLKLYIHRVNILRDIAIFIWPVWFELPIHAHFWGSFVGYEWWGSPWNWVQAQGVKNLECWGYQIVENISR